jgi:alpha-beta hydrolase superfamily lysophospholipase
MRQRIFVGFLAFLLVAAVAAVATAPPALIKKPSVLQLDADLDGYLSATEHAINAHTPIIPNTEKRIRWFQAGSQSKTAFSIVYLHGFSATRQEIAPVLALVADGLEANLFETRLAGHGLGTNALVGVQAEDWLDDAAEALQIGAAIGERVIVMGTSTGATLALAIVDHPSFDRVSSLVLISPNFGPRDTGLPGRRRYA